MKLRILLLTIFLTISNQLFANSSVYILYDFSGSYHNPDDQALVFKNEDVLSKLNIFIQNLYPTLPSPTNFTVIPIREVGLAGGSVHRFCLEMSVFASAKGTSCVSKKRDLRVELRDMEERIKRYPVYGNTDISGALKQAELYMKTQPNNKENIIVIFSDMAEYQMATTKKTDFNLKDSKILIVWRSVFYGQDTGSDLSRIDNWIDTFKSAGARNVIAQYEEGFWATDSVNSLRK